jgi:hypothetical protein
MQNILFKLQLEMCNLCYEGGSMFIAPQRAKCLNILFLNIVT